MLRKVRDAFVATDYEKLSSKDKEKEYNTALAFRKEAFQILADHYFDLWD